MGDRPDIEAIAARAAAAPEGPWRDDGMNVMDAGGSAVVTAVVINPYANWAVRSRTFIAASRTDVPALIAYVEALEAERDRLREALNQTDHFILLDDDGWHIEHLVKCRRSAMTQCVVHQRINVRAQAVLDEYGHGRFRLIGWRPGGMPILERADRLQRADTEAGNAPCVVDEHAAMEAALERIATGHACSHRPELAEVCPNCIARAALTGDTP